MSIGTFVMTRELGEALRASVVDRGVRELDNRTSGDALSAPRRAGRRAPDTDAGSNGQD